MFESGLLVISLPTLLLWTAWAQDGVLPGEARLRHLTANTAQLTCVITLDRSVYLPGESVVASIDASNATGAPLEVLDPLRMGRFSLYRKAEASAPDRLEWEPMWEIGTVLEDHTSTDLMSGVVTTVFQPNYRVQRRLSLMQNRESEPAHQRVSNLASGEYKLQCYPCGGVCFLPCRAGRRSRSDGPSHRTMA
jgi:hypothetical protein